MIIRFTSNHTGRWRDVDDEREYTRAIVDLCGGGFTELDTARAMEALQQLRSGEKVIRQGFTLENVKPCSHSQTYAEFDNGIEVTACCYCGARV